jgi:hypothetical protein
MNPDMEFWRARLTDRQLKEVEFSLIYQQAFNHGTDGHNSKLIIADMAKLLNGADALLNAVNNFRLLHSRQESGEQVFAELNDAYVKMLIAADNLKGDNA